MNIIRQEAVRVQRLTRRSHGWAALYALLLSGVFTTPASASAKLKVGDLPPDRIGRAASGEKIHLPDFRGRVVVISFWASWCPPCRQELPVMMKLQRAVPRDKLVVLSINWQQPAAQFRVLRDKLKDYGLTLVSDEYGSIGRAYGVTAIPHMVIVGKDGRIASIHIGYDESQLPAFVDEINAQLAKDVARN